MNINNPILKPGLIFLLLVVLIGSCESDDSDIVGDLFLNVDDILHVGISEGNFSYLTNLPGPHNAISIVTDYIYPCCNFQIVVDEQSSDGVVSLEILSVYRPEICLTALGPASYIGLVDLENGETLLRITNGNVINEIELLVTDSLITLTPLSTSFISVGETEIWRYRENSFVYSCGTMEASAWMYAAFKDSILSVSGVEQFYYPETGSIPYPRYPMGHYVDHACLYFQYPHEESWNQVKEKLVLFSTDSVSQYSGVGIFVSNYLGDWEYSWRWD